MAAGDEAENGPLKQIWRAAPCRATWWNKTASIAQDDM